MTKARDYTKLTDDQLTDRLAKAKTEDVVAALIAEIERREQIEQRIAELVSAGWEYRDAYAEAYGLDPEQLAQQERAALVRENRLPGESLEQTVDRMFTEDADRRYAEAEKACRGHMLVKESVGKVNPRELFCGPASRIRKHASPELKAWFYANGRITWREYMAHMLGRARDIELAKNVDRDYGEAVAA
ncbi:Hypothetical protein AJAP_42805 (plasmid) [Amycolatopsis japonica]|uniref:Uncharacterized protein n=1 Tax=Amycolatopsis japonica TaxID=208439 RepID=A0A075V774_9PSEU|nr:hypothetical protein [Amycolatopsis japonica]AIG81328.1 Hypothetical protein AJAP_42805 [Amycolatopsis japonica]